MRIGRRKIITAIGLMLVAVMAYAAWRLWGTDGLIAATILTVFGTVMALGWLVAQSERRVRNMLSNLGQTQSAARAELETAVGAQLDRDRAHIESAIVAASQPGDQAEQLLRAVQSGFLRSEHTLDTLVSEWRQAREDMLSSVVRTVEREIGLVGREVGLVGREMNVASTNVESALDQVSTLARNIEQTLDQVSTLAQNTEQTLKNMPAAMKPEVSEQESPPFIGTRRYWEDRYRAGGDSGSGSAAHLARFKAEILNDHVRELGIHSVVELGCGDGRQVALTEYPQYVGLDISSTAVRLCIERFSEDPTKSFLLYDPEAFDDQAGFLRCDMAISLDVIFHLVEDDLYETYLHHLFGAAIRSVVVYSSNENAPGTNPHIRHRKFTDDVGRLGLPWKLEATIPNRYPVTQYPHPEGSFSEFFFFVPE